MNLYRTRLFALIYALFFSGTAPFTFALTNKLEEIVPESCFSAGDYVQTKTLEGLGDQLTSHGSFIFSCDHGLIWNTSSPMQETLIYAAKGSQIVIRGDSVSQINNKQHKHLGKLLNGIIGGNTRYLKKYFSPQNVPDGIALKPKKRRMKKFISSITLKQLENKVNVLVTLIPNQQLSIDIFNTVVYEQFALDICLSEFPSLATACDQLF